MNQYLVPRVVDGILQQLLPVIIVLIYLIVYLIEEIDIYIHGSSDFRMRLSAAKKSDLDVIVGCFNSLVPCLAVIDPAFLSLCRIMSDIYARDECMATSR